MIIDTPLFVLTSDIDWASDPCISELTDFAAGLGIRPTLFSTHVSALVSRLGAEGAAEIGVHPNFLPNSSHGGDIASVVDALRRLGLAPVLKKSRWLLLKREDNLKAEQRFRLRDLLRYNLKTVRAYLLKEAFQQLWDYNSPWWAGKFLDEWCRQVMRSRIEPMKKIARSLRQHRELMTERVEQRAGERHRRRMHAARDQACDVGDVRAQLGPDFVGNFAEFHEIQNARVGGGAGPHRDDLVLDRERGELRLLEQLDQARALVQLGP